MDFLTYSCDLMQEVPPLDIPELLAYFVKQSGPLFDQLGIRRGMQAKPYSSVRSYFFTTVVGQVGFHFVS